MAAFLEKIRKIAGVLLRFLGAPALTDEPAVRNWAKRFASACQAMAAWWETTPEPNDEELDDKMAAALAMVIENDGTWALIYKLLTAVSPDDDLIIGENKEALAAVAEATTWFSPTDNPRTQRRLDVADIIAIIKAIVEILRSIWK